MNHKYFEDQMDDEDVLYVFRRHPVVMRKGLVLASLGVLVGPAYVMLLTFIYRNDIEKYPKPSFFFICLALSFVLGMLLMIPSWIGWYFSVFVVTNQRFIQITQKGFFHKSVVDIALNQIQMVNYEIAGIQETLLGFGTIMIQTYVGDLTIKEVHHPAHVQKKLQKILRDAGVMLQNFPLNTAARESE